MQEESEKKSRRGGARPNAGRKKAEGERHTYTVPEDVARWIRRHGDGTYITKVIRSIMQSDNKE